MLKALRFLMAGHWLVGLLLALLIIQRYPSMGWPAESTQCICSQAPQYQPGIPGQAGVLRQRGEQCGAGRCQPLQHQTGEQAGASAVCRPAVQTFLQ